MSRSKKKKKKVFKLSSLGSFGSNKEIVMYFAAGVNLPYCSSQVLGPQATVCLLSSDLVNFMVLTCLVRQRGKGPYHGQDRAGSTDPRWRGHLALHRAITPFTRVFPCAKPNG